MRQNSSPAPTPNRLRLRAKLWRGFLDCENPPAGRLAGPNFSFFLFDVHSTHCIPCQLVRYDHAMKMISMSEFSKIAGIRPETAWRIASSGKFPSAHRVGKLWKISAADCQEWLQSKPQKTAITPETAAKQIGCSGAHVRALLEKGHFSFAKKQPNRRWIIQNSEDYQRWISDQKRRSARRKKISILSGRDSGILNHHGILMYWQRWENKVGGLHGISKWPPDVQREWLEDMRPIAELISSVKRAQKQN